MESRLLTTLCAAFQGATLRRRKDRRSPGKEARAVIWHSRVLPLLALMLAGILVISGCAAGGRGIAQGWAGGAVAGDVIFVGSMAGKIVALDSTNGRILGEPVKLVAQTAGGGFGCLPTGSAAVAVYGSPVFSDDLVFIGGYDGKVRAFLFEENRLRADPRWISRQGDITGSIIGGLTVAGGRVYFGDSSGRAYALDAVDGHKLWHADIGGKVWSTPAVSDGTVFVGSFDRKLYALDGTDGSEKWAFTTEGTIVATPAVSGGMVYIASFDRHVYAVDAATGEQVWRFPQTDDDPLAPTGWFWASPVVHDGAVYAPNLDGRVYVIDAYTGIRISDFDLEGPVSSDPVLVDDRIVVATTSTNRSKQESRLYSLDTADRQQTLVQDLGESVHAPLFTDGNTVYVHTMKDSLFAVDPRTGASRKFTLAAGSEK